MSCPPAEIPTTAPAQNVDAGAQAPMQVDATQQQQQTGIAPAAVPPSTIAAMGEDESKKRAREEAIAAQPRTIAPFADDDSSKRARILEGQRFPIGLVLHCRNVPPGTSDDELAGIVSAVGGSITSLVTIANKQAFIQVDSVETSKKLLTTYNDPSTPALIRGQQVHIQTSSRTELVGGRVPGQMVVPGPDGSSTILMVVFNQVQYEINVDVLGKVFSPHGQLSKIVIFTKNRQTMALVQFVDAASAQIALNQLNGKNIYAGCCGMNISYSTSRNDLNVRFDSPTSRDFLAGAGGAPMPPGGGQSLLPPPPGGGGAPRGGGYQQQPRHQGIRPPQGGGGGGGVGTVVIVNMLDPEQVNPDYLFRLFGVYGDVIRAKIMFKKRDTALVQFTNAQGAYRSVQFLNNFVLWGRSIRCNISKGSEVNMPHEGNPFAVEYGYNHVMHRFKRPDARGLQYVAEPNPMLHVSSIPLGTQEEELKSYLAPFGDVLEVKFLQDSKYRQALVTMQTVQNAVDALVGLHNREIAERCYLRVNFSVAGSSYSKEERLSRTQAPPPQYGAAPMQYGGGPPQYQQQQQQQW